jgi:hypothetical protein
MTALPYSALKTAFRNRNKLAAFLSFVNCEFQFFYHRPRIGEAVIAQCLANLMELDSL